MQRLAHTRVRLAVLAAAIAFALVPRMATAVKPFAPTESEAFLLPDYCQSKLSENKSSSKRKNWQKVFGPTWLHMHHYCYALNFINRAKSERGNTPERRNYLKEAADNLTYMIERTNDKYLLAPDFYIYMGDVKLMSGDRGEAEQNYQKAASIKPDYPKSWLALSDLYKKAGRTKAAREALEKGLEASPEKYKDYLRRRLAELPTEDQALEQQPATERKAAK